MAYDLTKNQRRFVQRLAAQTGLNSRVLAAQVFSEMNGGAAKSRENQKYYNWLNIGHTDTGNLGLTGDRTWKDPIRAADATAAFFKGEKYGPSQGIRNIIKTAGKDPQEQIKAIGRSGWATNPAYESTIRSVWKNIEAPGASGASGSSASPSSGSSSGSGSRTVNIPSAVVQPDTDSSSALALIQAMSSQSQKSAPSSMGVAAPTFAAGPAGGQTLSVQGGGGPGPKGPDISALLSAVASVEQGGTQQVGEGQTVTVGGAQEPAPAAAPSSPKGGGSRGIPFNTTKGGYQGSQTVATSLAAIGKELGLKSTSEKRDNQNPYSGKGSDHEASKKNAYAYDLSNGSQPTPEMDRAAFRIMRALGFKDYKMGQPINTQQGVVRRGNYRIQVIYRGDGEEFGGNHKDHVHVGVERIR